MTRVNRSSLSRYGFAFVAIGLATGGRLLLNPWMGEDFPYTTVFLAIMLTAWYGGLRPAIAAVVLGALAADFFLLPPRGTFAREGSNQELGIILYLVTGFGISGLGGWMWKATRQAEITAEIAQRQAALIDQTYDAVLAWDWNGPLTFWNRGAERLYGFLRANALGRLSHDLLRTTTGAGGVETFLTSLERKGVWEGELEHTKKDGEKILVETRMTLVRQEGRAYVVEANRDITKRKQTEASAAQLSAIVESSDDAIIGKDLQGVVTSWNAGAQRLFGYTGGEMIGQSISRIIPAERQQEEIEILTRIRRGDCVKHFDTVRKRKDGSAVAISVTVSPIKDSAGKIIGASKVARDITERQRVEKALRESYETLEQKVNERTAQLQLAKERAEAAGRSKSEFMASMSHELRTPLNGIIGFSEFLVDGKPGPLNPKQKEYLEDVLNSGRHLLQLINDVLDLAKVEAGKIEFVPEPFKIAKAIGEVCAVAAPMAQKKRIAVTVTVAPALDEVTLDQMRFKQVVYNLLSNALKFTDGGGRVEIRCATDEPNYFILAVKDTGIGIRPQDLPRLFKEFEQIESGAGRRYEGTGLGLALTRKMVEIQGGDIEVESEPGKGSTFTVKLPLAAGEMKV